MCGGKHIPNKVKQFIGNKNITTNIYRIQECDSIMCGYFCIRFTNFMLTDKSLTDFTDLFSPKKIKDNDKITLHKKKKEMDEAPSMYPNDQTKFR